jgi:predicted ATPase
MPAEYERLKSLLPTPDRSQPIAIITALTGADAFGKTTLAAALCHDEDIIKNFDDGVLGVTLGQTPDLQSVLLTAYAALTAERTGFATVEDAAFELGRKLEEQIYLHI